MKNPETRIRDTIIEALRNRRPGASICPSEVARVVFSEEDWREMMEMVRSVAADLAAEGIIEVCQRGRPVDPEMARGPIRLRFSDSGAS